MPLITQFLAEVSKLPPDWDDAVAPGRIVIAVAGAWPCLAVFVPCLNGQGGSSSEERLPP
jgi:hypothetical protein